MGAAKSLDHADFIAGLSEQGVKNLVTTHQKGLGMQSARFTSDGLLGVTALTFATLGLQNMADTNYMVVINNPTDTLVYQEGAGTRTTAGFSVPAAANGAAVEWSILIVGQIANQPSP